MLEILVEKKAVIHVISLSLMTGSFSMFLDKCMEKGMILRKYYNLICYCFWLPKKGIGQVLIPFVRRGEGAPVAKIIIRPRFTKNKYQWLFKVLGGCVYCFGTWVAIVFYLVVLNDSRNIIPSLIGLFLFIGMNYFWIEVIQRIKR